MASTIFGKLKDQLAAAKAEYRARRKELERQITELDREYGALFGGGGGEMPRGRGRGKGSSGREYGGVKAAVLDCIKAGKGVKPAAIIEKTGLVSSQVHNALTNLKKSKLVKVRDGLYHGA
jgi:hypothetical protein